MNLLINLSINLSIDQRMDLSAQNQTIILAMYRINALHIYRSTRLLEYEGHIPRSGIDESMYQSTNRPTY